MAKTQRPEAFAWEAETRLPELIRLLGELADARRMRLFGTACCRRVEHLLTDPRSLAALAAGELLADGLLTEADRQVVNADAYHAWEESCEYAGGWENDEHEYYDPHPGTARMKAADAVQVLTAGGEPAWCAAHAAHRAREAFFWADTTPGYPLHKAEEALQVAFLRDVFGNPFRPVAFDPTWRSDTAVSLARRMDESRDFGAMPILADALQDAGCDEAEMLAHCRGGGMHVRGCWVVDAVLGKV